MSRTNPFAKHKPVTTSTLSSAEPKTPSRPDTPKRQFSGFKQHLQSLQREGRIPFSPHRREDEGRVDDGASGADEVIVPRLEYAKISTQFRASEVPSLTPTQQHHTPSASTPSSSRWRLLYRGGLEVGAERYTLPGIAFCARIRIPTVPTPAVTAVPPSSAPPSPTPSAQESAQSVNIEGKELAMREEGSYFSSLASVAVRSETTMTTTNGNSSTTDDPQSSSSYTSSSMGNKTTNARLRPLLHSQPPATINPTPNTPSGNNNTPNKAFTPAGPTGDTDLCLSLESMKGRKTLRVRGVERLQDDDLEVPEEDGDGEDGAVHVYLDPSPHDTGPTLLAQYIFNTLCRSPLTTTGRTRKALVVTLGDDVIDAQAGTFLIYGQLKSHSANGSGTGVERPKLELLATRRRRRKVVAVPERAQGVGMSTGMGVMRPGEPLPRDTLYANDVVGGFKVPTIPSSRGLRRTASVAAQAARMSRAKSSGKIYLPPPAAVIGGVAGSNTATAMSRSNSASSTADGVSTSTTTTTATTTKKLTPGRRGEKRKRPTDQQVAQDDERRRRAGKITAVGASVAAGTSGASGTSGPAESVAPVEDNDPFGQGGRIEESATSIIRPPSALRHSATLEWEGKNKASIKKRLLVALEARQCGRDHPEFKDVFSIANRGVCFALRTTIAAGPLNKDLIDRIVKVHLDLYLPLQPVNSVETLAASAAPSIPVTDTSPLPVVMNIRNNPDTTII